MKKLYSHYFFQRADKLVDHLVISAADIIRNAGLYMFGEQFTAESVQCRLHGCGLHEDIGAVCAFFHHALYASDLSLDTVQTVYQLLYSSGERCFFLWQQEQSQQHFSVSFSVSFNFSALPFLFVYSYIIYPRGVFVNRLDKKLTIDNRRLTKVSCGEILGAIYAVLVDLVMVIWYNGGNRSGLAARQIGIFV